MSSNTDHFHAERYRQGRHRPLMVERVPGYIAGFGTASDLEDKSQIRMLENARLAAALPSPTGIASGSSVASPEDPSFSKHWPPPIVLLGPHPLDAFFKRA
jgi:hypothetical protein